MNKHVDTSQTFEDLLIKGKMASELPDILKVSQKYASAPDAKNHSFTKDGFEYRTVRIEIDGQQFDVTINVGLNEKGKLIYTFNNIKRTPVNRSNRRFSSGDSIDETIANQPQIVNGDDVKYRRKAASNEEKTKLLAEREAYAKHIDSLARARATASYRLAQGERHKLIDIVNYVAHQTGLDIKTVSDIVKVQAEDAGINLLDERATKIRTTQDVPMLIDENGDRTTIPIEWTKDI